MTEGISRARAGLVFRIVRLVGALPSHTVRNAAYRRLMGVTLAPGAAVYGRAEIRLGRRIRIGSDTIIGHDAILDGRGGLEIGEHVNFSSQVAVWTMQHDPHDAGFGVRSAPVRIEDHAWVSFRATVLPGVTIGRGAVVSAGAVVTKDVAPYAIVGGVPATVIGERRRDLDYRLGPPWPFT